MERCIETAKQLIEEQVRMNYVNQSSEFLRSHKTYSWTNEDINSYLKLANFSDKNRGLTVLASGDQPFNLIANGINDIDTFDINPLAEYYALGLKRAMILKYDYKTFINMLSLLYNPWSSVVILTEIIKNLLPYMAKEHQIFWKTILDYNYKFQKEAGTQLNVILMLCLENRGLNPILLNNYLSDEASYNLVRSKLANTNVSFKRINALNLAAEYQDNKYDVILLSNILDYFHQFIGGYWSYDDLQNYEKELETLTKRNAIIFLHYIIGYKKDGEMYRDSIINKTAIMPHDLTSEEIVEIPANAFITNGVVLKRVK